MVVWSLSLPTDSEGPTLIPCAARLLSGGPTGLPSAPSWHTVVGIPDKTVAAPGEFPIELVQHDVTEQRRKRTPLRGPLLRAHHYPVRHYDLGLEHLADKLEQAPIFNALL